jgi:serine/threonine protein kinase
MSHGDPSDFLSELDEDMLNRLYAPKEEDYEDVNKSSIYREVQKREGRYGEPTLLGEGGMKRVSRVMDHKLGVEVAFAELRKELSTEFYEIFLQEAQLTSRLQHPNIIHVLDIGVLPDGRPYFTMELKSGDSLGDILKNMPLNGVVQSLSVESSLQMFVKICDAVAYAHDQGVLHLDLKPDNIQVGNFGEVLVCDWGIGKVLALDDENDEDTLLNPDYLNEATLRGKVRGSPGYMAPEQIRGEEKVKESDVYGLGCLLYSLSTGKSPFHGSPDKKMNDTLMGNWRAPRDCQPQKPVSPSLEAVIVKAMSDKVEDRYPSADVMRQEVLNVLNDHPTVAENASSIKVFIYLYRRNRRACWTGIFGLLLLALVSAILMKGIQDQEVIAKKNLIKAEDALQVSGQQRVYIGEMKKVFGDEVILNVYKLWGDNRYALALDVCHQFLKVNPNHVKVIALQLETLFCLQKFSEGLSVMNRAMDSGISLDRFPKHLRVIAEYIRSHISLSSGDLYLPADEFLELLKAHTHWPEKAVRMFMCNRKRYAEIEEQYPLVLEIISILNPEWKGKADLPILDGKRSLQLSGEGLYRLNVHGHVVLETLWLYGLDISHTQIEDLQRLVKLQLKRLVICDTPITNLEPLKGMRSLRELVISEGQYSPEQLRLVPKGVTVVTR